MKKVSIIIPVFNAEKCIHQCINSIIKQTYNNIEIVLINDASVDNTISIISEYSAIDSRIVIVNNMVNKGTMRARESGYTIASGDYIMFCDSDDILPLNSVETLVKNIILTNSDIVCGSFQYIYANGSKGKIIVPKFDECSSAKECYKLILNNDFKHSLWAKIYSARLFKNFTYQNYDNMTNSEDAMLMYQLIGNCEDIVSIKDVVCYYYVNYSSVTHTVYSVSKLNNVKHTSKYLYELIESKHPELLALFFKKNILSIINLIKTGTKYDDISKYAILDSVYIQLNYKHLRKFFTKIDSLYYHLIFNVKIYRKYAICTHKSRKKIRKLLKA